jgi:hypothetical protein
VPRPDLPVSLYARGPICPEACKVPKTGLILTLILTLTQTNTNESGISKKLVLKSLEKVLIFVSAFVYEPCITFCVVFEALDVVCREIYFQKCGQIGPRAKNNRANRAVPINVPLFLVDDCCDC